MVHKKTHKAIHKKKNRKHSKNTEDKVSLRKKDFETFAFGVERLKELKKELDSLNTRGFYQEAQEIKSRLKTVSEIPTIERLMKTLKLKINKKYAPRKKRKSHAVEEIHEDIEDIKGQIKGLKSSRKQNIEEIKGVIKKLKNTNNIDEIKGEIKGLKTSGKRGFEDIKKEIDSINKKKRKPVDSEVDILVDTNFNEFLSDTKKALSERIQNREKEMDSILQTDLEKREGKYKQKHDSLLKDFEQKKKQLESDYEKRYKKKVESTLHREVSEKFNQILKEKLNDAKIELGKSYTAELKDHAEEHLKKREDSLEKQFKTHLSNRLRSLQKEHNQKMLEETKKKEHAIETIEEKKKALEDARQKLEIQKQEELRKIKNKLANEFHANLSKELEKKEKFLRNKLSNEYELKLKRHIQDHEDALKKKKFDLELEMQRKIKQVLD